jgi:peptide/nickel transport system ATP-binding protein
VLYAGALLEVGDSRAMEERPGHPYTYGLLTSEPPLERRLSRLVAIPGNVPAAAEVLDECAFATRCRWVAAECRIGRPALADLEPGRASACVRIAAIRDELVPRAAETGEIVVTPESEEAGATVQVRGLVKVFGHRQAETTALAGVSLHVDAGESVGLVGESGSGKTTLARCLVGLEQPTGGEIRVRGVDVTDYQALSPAARAAARQTVQIVFQDPYSTLNPVRSVNFTLFEALRRVHGRAGMPRRRVSDLLELVQLPASYADRKPAALSGGERQRVAIARALALQPQILVCDEPVSALDVSVQAQVLNLLDDLRRSLGVGYLFISHDLAVVRQVTDRVYVLHRGAVVEEGPTERVLDHPTHPYTRSLIDSVPQSDPTWLAPLAAPTQL